MFDLDILTGILNIIIINLVLSGDNAVVIAMASMGLSEKYRKKAIFWGTTLAVVMRIILTFVAAVLLQIPYIQFVGGTLLAMIAFKLLFSQEEGHGTGQGSSNFTKALLTILWADLLMSLDNVLAVAGASQGNLYLLIFGLAFSIPIVLAGSTLLTKAMGKYPWLAYIGSGVLAWTAGKMVVEDKAILPHLHALPVVEIVIPALITAAVIGTGIWVRNKKISEVTES
ncbi:YjbE family putative metal transport protein [Heliobacillus mobilis]|uniref:YjbE family putative metal transport protein n=1 Tax=Heliobacterium mobile TaxID=28064 RepID=A0A6I3SIN6_HELMO|nr:TerC family protein [Heliobacterium mobile]MTV48741.1 YjbE family putative metal transport protein [Heliobacterium mobile]